MRYPHTGSREVTRCGRLPQPRKLVHMMPATTALMILKSHDDDVVRSISRRGELRRRQRRFQQHARLRKLLA